MVRSRAEIALQSGHRAPGLGLAEPYGNGHLVDWGILTVHFEFERCPVVWRHRLWGAAEYSPETSNGIFLYSDKATLFVTDDRWVAVPNTRGAQRQTDSTPADTSLLHVRNWLEAVRARKPAAVVPE